ncbi:DAK2 domain-containing protein [Carbonactinospora thermoautotrophica]|uniref:DAK2 domain fusion protein YloV n=1 Tax=Carbonactinospora thermoautotrophica TaxID=1469144 RepID=A0A132N1R8_9ACTN|nr:DAK2 domain-containing protein [Carbonactinospora thermoautotrophica]KWW99641.1 DAK2 domain fusion protein YloV [Carbonactinospora thermoautotrophica]KWX03987.1 dihydroxyacetone kinase [Carbonactinospora thermoautotrophica]KWX09930.1 dihydroxyacetone kinase [Carbonactinospora thermoautotrophica]MCX9191793.1 DAK2 domain-containing protein [Carbonactinospora thermoautotrophica]
MSLDASAVRRWCRVSLEALGRAREEIDALNVYPVPDGDTGTNLFLTMEAVVQALEPEDGTPAPATLPEMARAITHGALMGARGNSGVILSQLLRGFAEVLGAEADPTGVTLRKALHRAAELGYSAVVHPVEGTVLTVARAAAEAAEDTGSEDLATVARAAADGAREALARTPEQLEVLRRAGVVDAGGQGLCVLLDALVEVVTGHADAEQRPRHLPVPERPRCDRREGPAYEVMYLLDAPDEAIPRLKDRLDRLGDSLVVVGGDGLWNVHVHVDDAGAAVEAGIEAGRPHRIRITHFGDAAARREQGDLAERAVVTVAYGPGLADLFESAGAGVIRAGVGHRPSTREFVEALRRAHAREVVLMPNDPDSHAVAEAAAEQVRADGLQVAVLPTKAEVQALAALAVHEPGRRFYDDVVAMTSAAGATRFAALTVATREAWTSAGVCQAGDVLGLIEGDVALIGQDLLQAGIEVVERMLASGGELVTLVAGADAPGELTERIVAHLRHVRPEVDTVVYHGGQECYPLLIGVE